MARLARAVQSSPGATVFGYGIQTSPELAALANGTMVRTDDYNDAYFGHPSDMIPGVLAAGEIAHSSGKEVLTAITLAYEVYGAFSRSGPYHLDSGLDYGLSMNVGVALAAGRLWNFTEAQLANAASVALVPNLPLGVARWGALSMMKGCNTAFSARNGVFGAMLAREGFTSAEEPYEGIFGLQHFTGPFDLRLPLHSEKRVVEMTYVKPIPAENNTIGVIELAPKIRAWALVDEIESIDIEVATGLDVHLADEPKYDPRTRETADHSFPYMLARALVDGGLTLASYAPDRIEDPSIRPLMRKIRVHPNAEMKSVMKASEIHEPEAKPARVTVKTRTGRVLAEDVMGHSGHPDRPASTRRDVINAKLDICAEAVQVGIEQRERIRGTWWRVAEVSDIGVAMATVREFGSLR
jgi:2-methylcitrate dehydratase